MLRNALTVLALALVAAAGLLPFSGAPRAVASEAADIAGRTAAPASPTPAPIALRSGTDRN